MIKITFFILLILSFTSCTTKRAYISQYKLNTTVKMQTAEATSCKQQSLKVADAFSVKSLMLEEMKYMSGRYKMDTFNQSEWAESPNKALTTQTIKALENSQLYKNISGSRSYVKSDLILETTIENFIQSFSDNETKSKAKVAVNVTLIDTKTKKSLGQKRFVSVKKSETMNAYGGVVALNLALSEVLEEEIKWLREKCQ